MIIRKRNKINSREDDFRQQADKTNRCKKSDCKQEEEPNDPANERKQFLHEIFKGMHWLPWIYLAILAYYILPEKETFALMVKSGHVIGFGLFVLLVIVFFIMSYFFEWLFKESMKGEDSTLEATIGTGLICLLFPVLSLSLYDRFVVDTINDSEVSPPTTVETYVSMTGSHSRYRGPTEYYIEFYINGKTERCELPRDEWENFSIGDPISVTYSIGCLNRMVFNNVHVINKKMPDSTRWWNYW